MNCACRQIQLTSLIVCGALDTHLEPTRVDMTCQAMPHYVGTCKMHKDPSNMRFISSSNTSSMRSVSLMINKLLTQLLPGVDALFASVFQSVGIDAKWTQHSWILKNTAAAIPLIMHGMPSMHDIQPHTLYCTHMTLNACTPIFHLVICMQRSCS